MMQDKDIQTIERQVFRSTVNDGLADMRAGFILSILAIAPLLSSTLGDFWSTVVWLPVYLAADVLLRLIKRRVVIPRLGHVQFGPERKARIRRTLIFLLGANILSFIAGLVFSVRISSGFMPSPWTVSTVLALFLVAAFSAAGLMMQLNRFFIYGLGTGLAALAGEWLFQRRMASHHGFPVVFGAASVILIGIGVLQFMHFLHHHPSSPEGEKNGRE
ncbi:hypothetical protein JW906_08705 [bacterium]|nr:hypothetical protein [bacterium]